MSCDSSALLNQNPQLSLEKYFFTRLFVRRSLELPPYEAASRVLEGELWPSIR